MLKTDHFTEPTMLTDCSATASDMSVIRAAMVSGMENCKMLSPLILVSNIIRSSIFTAYSRAETERLYARMLV